MFLCLNTAITATQYGFIKVIYQLYFFSKHKQFSAILHSKITPESPLPVSSILFLLFFFIVVHIFKYLPCLFHPHYPLSSPPSLAPLFFHPHSPLPPPPPLFSTPGPGQRRWPSWRSTWLCSGRSMWRCSRSWPTQSGGTPCWQPRRSARAPPAPTPQRLGTPSSAVSWR